MVFESEGGGGASGGEAELVYNFFPQFVVRDGLASSLFADSSVEFVEVELLASDLWYFDLSDALGGPVLVEMLFKFVLLF